MSYNLIENKFDSTDFGCPQKDVIYKICSSQAYTVSWKISLHEL